MKLIVKNHRVVVNQIKTAIVPFYENKKLQKEKFIYLECVQPYELLKILRCFVFSVPLYRAEAWIVTNRTTLERIGKVTRNLGNSKTRRAVCFRHVMRNDKYHL